MVALAAVAADWSQGLIIIIEDKVASGFASRDIEDFELNTLGFGTDGIEVKKGDDRLYTGLNLVWNGPVKFHPEVGIASIDQKSNGSDEELRAGLYDGGFVLDGKIEEFMGFSYKKYWVSSDAANDFQECTKSFCDGDGPDGRAPHDALFFALGYLDVRDLSVEMVCKSLRDAVQNDRLILQSL
ncbi:hypothetical protein F0562_026619 [Nyssa sinensis]|uniref:Uncharacterized protein n=1 Tax=Nyssa sinensis TaxID=561372 RepID=A0A5J5BDZ2_9ASTE|nr:hypothetical protein F0562_026619 [Nyssa sinensis]